ncbi:hypothetical protein BCU68_08850 [Vibrio sp. 10N.286.49.B3]|uniref:sensor domain-containing diguanylate cyclase n=1 Tax=Vibrio sp. 10N.286.49.B3 TaxID=1880855 RepID=UPI000C818E8B|nr:diguanylate cyclase [Vibrio sp. 10N.286.49.B3]PMH46168.1 hypothetical protein BCU68_08850 [Vibrio sp. 10N.286.49.B3]
MNKSVWTDLSKTAAFFTLLTILFFGTFQSYTLYRSGIEKAHSFIKQKNQATTYFIEGYFSEINNIVEYLSSSKNMLDVYYGNEEARNKLLDEYRLWTRINENITHVYSGYINKDMVISGYQTPEDYDPTNRPWYKAAIDAKPEIFTGLAYRDVKYGTWLLSTGKVIVDEQNTTVGAIAIDSRIDVILDKITSKDSIYNSAYTFVTTPRGDAIIHPNVLKLNHNFFDAVELSASAYHSGDYSESEGMIEYSTNGVEKLAYYRHGDEIDWVIVTVIDKQEIIAPILKNIFKNATAVIFIAILFGLAQNRFFHTHYSLPIRQLHKKISSAAVGKECQDNSFSFPDNEIKQISDKINHLTSQEVYKTSVSLKENNSRLEQENSLLESLSITDSLTGLNNRHKIDLELNARYQQAITDGMIFSILLIDIDRFKRVNDTYGHLAGDSVLKDIAELLSVNLRYTDMASRWGGEEFLILCPQLSIKQAEYCANKLRLLIASHEFSIAEPVTVSIGVCVYEPGESIHNLIKQADENLYAAKANGRNQVVASDIKKPTPIKSLA